MEKGPINFTTLADDESDLLYSMGWLVMARISQMETGPINFTTLADDEADHLYSMSWLER